MSRYTVVQGRYPDNQGISWCVLDSETGDLYPFVSYFATAEAAEEANSGELDISEYCSDSAIIYIPGEEVTTIYQEAVFESLDAKEPLPGTVRSFSEEIWVYHADTRSRVDMMRTLGYNEAHARDRMITIGEWEL